MNAGRPSALGQDRHDADTFPDQRHGLAGGRNCPRPARQNGSIGFASTG